MPNEPGTGENAYLLRAVDTARMCTENAVISALKSLGIPLTSKQEFEIQQKRIQAIPNRNEIERASDIRDVGTIFYNNILREHGYYATPSQFTSYEQIRNISNATKRVLAIIDKSGRVGGGLHIVHVRDTSHPEIIPCDDTTYFAREFDPKLQAALSMLNNEFNGWIIAKNLHSQEKR